MNLCYSKALTYKYKHCTISGTLCNMTYFYFQVQSQLCLPLGITLIIKEGTAKMLSDECLGIELPVCLETNGRAGKGLALINSPTPPGGTHVH